VLRPRVQETTALGAALLAGVGVGMFADPAAAVGALQADETAFRPRFSPEERSKARRGWMHAVDTALHWAKDTDLTPEEAASP